MINFEKMGRVIGALIVFGLGGIALYLVHIFDDKWTAMAIGFGLCSLMYRLGGAQWPTDGKETPP